MEPQLEPLWYWSLCFVASRYFCRRFTKIWSDRVWKRVESKLSNVVRFLFSKCLIDFWKIFDYLKSFGKRCSHSILAFHNFISSQSLGNYFIVIKFFSKKTWNCHFLSNKKYKSISLTFSLTLIGVKLQWHANRHEDVNRHQRRI